MNKLVTHLLVAVAAFAAGYAWHYDEWPWKQNDILVTTEIQQILEAAFRQAWQRAPSADERDELIDDYVREELAYREATAMELGREDVVVRNKLRQMLEAEAEAQVEEEPPSREELRAWLEGHPDEFRVDRNVTLRQVFFDTDGNAIGADASARFMLGRLQSEDMPENIAQYGDASPVPNELESVSESELASLFGRAFVFELGEQPIGRWRGPLRSNLGLHLVYVQNRDAGRLPPLAEVDDAVYASWLRARREQAIDQLYEELRRRYDVIVVGGE